MGLRFRKSFKLAPGLRLNMSKSGFSLSAGVRGASMTFGPRGPYRNVGIPGTGLSFREKVGLSPRQSSTRGTGQILDFPVTISLEDDGAVVFKDSDGNRLLPKLVELTKKQQGEAIRDLLAKECKEINDKIESLETIHHATPSPDQKPQYVPRSFSTPAPLAPTPKPLGLWGLLFKRVRERIERENVMQHQQYENELRRWWQDKAAFERDEAE